MKKKFKFTLKDLHIYIISFLILANIAGIYYIYKFAYQYVYLSFHPSEEILSVNAKAPEDVNTVKFDNIMKKVDKKIKADKIVNYRNLFE